MNKYHAVKVHENGYIFDSKMEHKRYLQLRLLETAGRIKFLTVHRKYKIEINGKEVCKVGGDFSYVEDGRDVCEDVKGRDTPVSRLKRKLIKACYPDLDWRVITRV